MKIKFLIAVIVLIPLLVTNVALAEPLATGNSELSGTSYKIDQYIVADENLNLAPGAGNTDVAVHNQDWKPEKPNKFKSFKYHGWATDIKTLAPGYYFVGTTIPLITYLDGTKQYVKYVEFCARSSNGAESMPDYWAIHEKANIWYSDNISWPADNDTHCFGYTFNPGRFLEDLSVSVRLYYKNTTHVISMEKAWVRTYASP